MNITVSSVSLEAMPFKPMPRVRMTFRQPRCECIVANLPSILEITVDGTEYPGIVDAEIIATGDSCEDVVYSGGPNDFDVTAVVNFSGVDGWQLSLDGPGDARVLIKVSTGCAIASPAGHYEGDGYTATVGIII